MQSGDAGGPVQTEFRVSTDPVQIDQMKERLRQRAAQNPGSVGRFSTADSSAGASDPVERLAKLADLHDRGALTDAEFAAEKANILDER